MNHLELSGYEIRFKTATNLTPVNQRTKSLLVKVDAVTLVSVT